MTINVRFVRPRQILPYALLGVALSAVSAKADSADQLEAQLRIMQDQIRHLQQQIEDNRAEARAQAEKQAAKKKDDLDL
ncbi:hypothetical protein, partial [Hyphomicrobium sulfonivorans]|uniref:hypothetical protein n=1 Tax=Hyphomicrobium sulfonivorans TaxID=121290 RepID=UPI000AC1830B